MSDTRPACPYAEGRSMTCSCGQCHLPPSGGGAGPIISRSAIRMRAVQDPVGLAHDYIEAACELSRLRLEVERLRLGFCDEAYILMVQAVDYPSMPKGRKRILTEQAVRMAKVGLSRGWPRGRDRHAERLAADVLAALDPSPPTSDPASERLGPEADNHA